MFHFHTFPSFCTTPPMIYPPISIVTYFHRYLSQSFSLYIHTHKFIHPFFYLPPPPIDALVYPSLAQSTTPSSILPFISSSLFGLLLVPIPFWTWSSAGSLRQEVLQLQLSAKAPLSLSKGNEPPTFHPQPVLHSHSCFSFPLVSNSRLSYRPGRSLPQTSSGSPNARPLAQNYIVTRTV